MSFSALPHRLLQHWWRFCKHRLSHCRSMASDYKNPTEVEVNKYISVENAQRENQALFVGKLLKAMDITSCLSAERHAKMPCVTLMMDDLEFNEASLSMGHSHVLNLKGKLTRAFGSSMEVVVDVAVEDLQGHRTKVCQAFFTYVALAKTGKAKLTHLDPFTVEERLQYALAIERRKMRFAARNRAKAKGEQQAKTPTLPTMPKSNSTYTMSQTRVESIELVLPSHANHNKSTFGGQIMAWLTSVCTISASRLCHTLPSIVAVNDVVFSGPSSVGDRLVFKAMVNKTFDDNSMEVGCSVEARSLDGVSRHINSAYLVFVDFDEHDQRKPLPDVVPTTADEIKHQSNAATRRQSQIDEKKVLASVGPALSVPWSQANASVLALHNVSAFRKLCHLDNWQEVSKDTETILYKSTQDQLQCVKFEATFPIAAPDLFRFLNENERAAWDPIFTESKTLKKIDEDDKIVHFVMATSDKSTQPDDLLVLQSSREASTKNDDYVIAYRSIIWESLPPAAGYNRKEIFSSGFLVKKSEKDPEKSSLIYINQITAQLANYVSSDLIGKTKMYAKRIEKLRDFISETVKH